MKSYLRASLALGVATSLVAQGPQPAARLGAGPQLAPSLWSSLRWRNIGPAIFGGRITDIEVVRRSGQPDQIYILPENGGVMRSTNGGTSWTSLFDDVNSLMSMGDIAVAPSNPNVIWVSTGHGNNPAYYWGEGVYKSVDGGQTWTFAGLKETQHIGRVRIHPTNPDIVFVAAAGGLWGPNSDRGVFKTIDGGRTWKKVLFVDDNTGAHEIVIDPTNPNVMLASTSQRQRKGYGGIGQGPGSAIYKSEDGGETWRKITKGLPTVDMGRIGLTISLADPKLIYADIEVGGGAYPFNDFEGDCPPDATRVSSTTGTGRGVGRMVEGQGGVYRSTDGGETWEQGFARFDTPAGTFLRLWADPKDRNRVYRDGVSFYVSDDMGRTFRNMATGLHADYRALWIDPDNNHHLLIASDGGFGISWDRGVTWEWKNNIPLAQFWEVSVDQRDPYFVCGGAQDNGNWCMPSAVRNRNGISNRDAFSVGGGDGMHFHVDPNDSTFALTEVNSSSTTNSITRIDLTNLQRQALSAGQGRPKSCLETERGAAAGAPPRGVGGDPSYRWAWNTPILFSSVTPGVVYTAANVVFRSTDRGGSWKRISGDLTSRVNRDTVRVMGKAIGAVNYSPGGGPSMNPNLTALYGQVTWIGESPLDGRVLYTGSDDGQVYVTRDGGESWKNITPNIPALAPFTFVSSVVASRFARGRVYATFDGHFNNDFRTYVYTSEDFGQTWRSIAGGLPTTSVNRIAEHPREANLLVIGHARGAHFSNDRGATWHSLSTNMPTIPVRSVVFQPRDNALILGTYARGVWILDDVAPLHALTADATKADALLVSITRGRQWNLFSLGPTYGHGDFYAPNPEFNPVITYYVRDAASGNATLTISDSLGKVVRTLPGPAATGLNRVIWDMHMDAASPSAAPTGGRGGGRGGGAPPNAGPLVLPGRYGVSIAFPGIARPLRGALTVQSDPIDKGFSAADRRRRQDAMLSMFELQKRLSGAQLAVRSLTPESLPDSTATRLRRLQAELDRLIGIASSMIRTLEDFNSAPTPDQQRQMQWALEDEKRAVALLDAIRRR
jgi:photosystem II stability/assembly factor-like uncharacterized protein